uniref:C2 domain-containing protein n=1 Tax=Nelumbo nucifera TaxID=4432 RepID=A0A822Z2Y8_NELNU|nr:TPA_asm: hypothetical protein HUJ06_013470 [Nelumbo nucifera]
MHIFCNGSQKLKTRVMKKNINPEWNEDLTLFVADPKLPIKLIVYDKDKFSLDDKMGDADIDIKPFLEVVKMHLVNLPSGTIIQRIVQDMYLRLKNVESGEVELQLQWIDIPGSRGI